MKYEPSLFAMTHISMSIIFLLKEFIAEHIIPDKFDRETFKLEDGGTVGIDWVDGIPDPESSHEKPLLLIAPGLGGGSHNLYSLALLWEAKKRFKVGTILFRGGEGLPLTTSKLSHAGCWTDIREILQYVDKKYVRDSKTGRRRTRVYVYGCSLGAQILGLYLGRAGKEANDLIDAAILFSTPWSTERGNKFFAENFGGWFNYAVGINLNKKLLNG